MLKGVKTRGPIGLVPFLSGGGRSKWYGERS